MEEVATLGGGCFWCLDAVYRALDGVIRVESGYAGGHLKNPSYQAICSGETGHAEVVRIHYDTECITFNDLLEVFFAIHDPTTLNRQGHDLGTQYRSVIFYHNEVQREAARAMIDELNRRKSFNSPIVTELAPAPVFYPAEAYHQDYFVNNPRQPYCQAVIAPKLAKFRNRFAAQIKTNTPSP